MTAITALRKFRNASLSRRSRLGHVTSLEGSCKQIYIALNDATCVLQFRLGYRHINTAHAYRNDRGVRAAIARTRVAPSPRDEVRITTKLWPTEYEVGKTPQTIEQVLERLGTDHINLLLRYQKFGDYLGAWQDMERAVEDGRVRSIGLPNFESSRPEEVLDAASIPHPRCRWNVTPTTSRATSINASPPTAPRWSHGSS